MTVTCCVWARALPATPHTLDDCPIAKQMPDNLKANIHKKNTRPTTACQESNSTWNHLKRNDPLFIIAKDPHRAKSLHHGGTAPNISLKPPPVSQELGNPVCAVLKSAESATTATSLNARPYGQELGKPVCAAPQECRKCHACHVSESRSVEPGARQPCLRSPSGVPKLPRLPRLSAADRVARSSATLSAHPRRSAESATPATSLSGGPYSQEVGNPVCAAPQECRKCHACHVSGQRTVWPGARQPCLRSPSGVPKMPRQPRLCAANRIARSSATLSAQARRNAEVAPPDTSLSARVYGQELGNLVCAAPQECRKCHECHVSERRTVKPELGNPVCAAIQKRPQMTRLPSFEQRTV